jgi:hypothetical protein
MRRAIIHIGMPRTGSTSLQWVLARLRQRLKDEGILYPDLTPASARATPHISHQHFGETFDGRRPRRENVELLQALSAALRNWDGDVVLVSYEDFIQQQPRFRVPQILGDFFAAHGFEAEAITAVKPQSELLNSIYTHRTQMINERRTFAEFVPHLAHSGRFDYATLIQPWIEAFAGRVRAVAVRDRSSDAPILMRLLTTLELDKRVTPLLRPADLARVENRSPGPLSVEISRRLRAMRIHTRLTVLPRNMMRFVEREVQDAGYDAERFQGVSPDMRAQMAADYRDTNDRFAQAVWARRWDDIVAPEDGSPVNELVVCGISSEAEGMIREISKRAARQFNVPLRQSMLNRPLNRLIESADWAQRLLRYSRWRVL